MAVTDLTGTKWLLNSNLSIGGSSDSDATYNLNFKSNNVDFTIFRYSAMAYRLYYRLNSSDAPGTNTYTGNPPSKSLDDPSTTGTWADEAYRTIEITGGTDATNATLIAWLQANAAQIVEPANTFSIGNLPIANMYFGALQAKKVYFGNSLIWESATEPIPENALLVQDGALLTNDNGYLITTEVTIISFDILGDTYQAEEGMTWAEWCASEYNTDGYKVGSDGKIYNSISSSQVTSGKSVSSFDIIHANVSYNRLGVGGADQ